MAPVIAAALIGGAATIGGGLISSYSQNKAAEAERDAREKAANKLREQGQITDAEYRSLIGQINAYYNNRGSLGTASDANAYKQAIAGYNPEDYAYNFGDFNYDKTKEDFLNPYYGRIIGDTANTIQHTAAGAGLGRGTGAALNIAKGTAEKSDELYRTAMSEYNADRNFAYQQYNDAIQNNQNKLNAIRTATEFKLGLQGNLAQDYYNTQDSRMSDIMQAQQDRLNAQQNYSAAIAGLY